VSPGTVLFSRPGEVRQWAVPRLDGACLFFTEEFLATAFRDPRFLEQFPYFREGRRSAALHLGPGERRQFRQRFALMQKEIAALRADASHALRAVLYELLVLLGRWYGAAHGAAPATSPPGLVERFRGLVEREFAERHRVSEYAAALGVSPGHLGAMCRRQHIRSPRAWIHGRLALEAKRLLRSSDLTVAEVADHLGFVDPAYFARFFRREAGCPPGAFRKVE
jgi:AraC-like DNA-binding protein